MHVGVSHTTSAFMVPALLCKFHEIYPEVQVKVTRALPPQLSSGLESELFDVCLCFEPPRTAPLVWRQLFRTDLVGISSPKLASAVSENFSEFARLKLVLPSRQCSYRFLLDTELQKLGIVPCIAMEIDDPTSLVSMVKHGLAVSIIPRTMITSSRNLLKVNLSKPQITVNGGVLLPKVASRAVMAFVEVMEQEIEQARTMQNRSTS